MFYFYSQDQWLSEFLIGACIQLDAEAVWLEIFWLAPLINVDFEKSGGRTGLPIEQICPIPQELAKFDPCTGMPRLKIRFPFQNTLHL